MIFLQSRCGKLRLTPEAVTDVAALLTYYRLAFSLTAQEQRKIATKAPDDNARQIAEHYKKLDQALALVAANLEQEYDLFKISIAHQEVSRRMSERRNRRAKQLSLSPQEYTNELARLATGQGAGDGERCSELNQGESVASVDSRSSQASIPESVPAGECDKLGRQGTRPAVGRRSHQGKAGGRKDE